MIELPERMIWKLSRHHNDDNSKLDQGESESAVAKIMKLTDNSLDMSARNCQPSKECIPS